LTVIDPRKKLAIGTVQLGLPYGINNRTGKPNLQDSFRILDCALKYGIHMLDSADAYGDSIQVIGSYLKAKPETTFNIISKFTDDGIPIKEKFYHTLAQLGIQQLYGYMYHRFDDYRSGKYKMELLQLREDEKVARIGASIYDIKELEAVVKDDDISLIQIPLNPFDSSPEKLGLLKEAKLRGKEIHVRSVFLQGLFFSEPEELKGNLTKLKSPLKAFREILVRRNLDVRQACLNYALHQSDIDFAIIGIDTSEQLAQNIEAILPSFSPEIMLELQSIPVLDSFLLNPSNWKP